MDSFTLTVEGSCPLILLNIQILYKYFCHEGLVEQLLLLFIFFKKWSNPGLFLFIFVLFSLQFQYKLKKIIDGVLGIRTRGHRMVGPDKTMELWRPSHCFYYLCTLQYYFNDKWAIVPSREHFFPTHPDAYFKAFKSRPGMTSDCFPYTYKTHQIRPLGS